MESKKNKKNSITIIDNRTGRQKEIILPDGQNTQDIIWGDLNISIARLRSSKPVEEKPQQSTKTFKEDWTCTFCRTVNFGSRSSDKCFKCSHPKPLPPPDLEYPKYEYMIPEVEKITGSWKCSWGGLSTTVNIGTILLPETKWLLGQQIPKESIDIIKIVNQFVDWIERLRKDSHTTFSGNFSGREHFGAVLVELMKISPLIYSYNTGGTTWSRDTTVHYGFVLSPKKCFRLYYSESEYNVPGERDPSL